MTLEDLLIVHSLSGATCLVEASTENYRRSLGVLEFVADGVNKFSRAIADEDDRLYLTRELTGLGAAFSVGPGWPPADVIARFHEQGLVAPPWRTIGFTGGGGFRTDMEGKPEMGPPEPYRPWAERGCAVCRQQVLVGGMEPMLGECFYRRGRLYRCGVCGMWWESLDRYANELAVERVREFYPRAYREAYGGGAASGAG